MVSWQTNWGVYSVIGKRTRMVGGCQISNMINKTMSSLIGKIKAQVVFVIRNNFTRLSFSFTFTIK